MIRLHFVVEGQTEETFVNQLLANHLGRFDVSADAHRITTGRQGSRLHRGGMTSYQRVRRDLDLWMRQDRHKDAYFTTMFDLYALPNDFPGFAEADQSPHGRARVAALETAFAEDIAHPRFVPYIQLHEFEALIFPDPGALDQEFLEHGAAIDRLVELAQRYPSPECIDDALETAPSKRTIREIPAYEGRKVSAGPLVVARIGLDTIRTKCPHFDSWLCQLEALGDLPSTDLSG